MTLLDANAHPAESLRLSGERWGDLRALGFLPVAPGPDTWSEEVRAGKFPGPIWIGPGDEAVGIVRWEELPRAGRRAEVHLTAGFRNPGAVSALVRELEGSSGPAPFRYAFPTLGRPAPEVAPGLEPLGFRHFRRYEMTFALDEEIPPLPVNPKLSSRPVREEDEPELVRLGTRTYADWPLDPGYFSPGMSVEEDQVRGFHDLFSGVYGPWMRGAATAVEADGRLVGATMVNDRHGPLLTEVLADPDWRRQGVASTAIVVTLRALRAMGAPRPRLNVTGENRRARALYERLGFRVTPLPEDNMWVAFDRLHRADLSALLPRIAASDAPPQGQ